MKNYCIIHILLFILLMLVYQCSHAQRIVTTKNVGQGNAIASCQNICDPADSGGHKISPATDTVVQPHGIWDDFTSTVGNYLDRTSDRVRKTWRQAITRLDFTDEVNRGLKRCAEKITSLLR